MQPKKYARLASLSVKTLGLSLAASCLVYSGADAAGLGKLTVLSSLGQPLRAEIELTSVGKEDVGSINPKLASLDAFRQANIDFNYSLSSLRFSVEDRGSRHFVLITSTQSINEPFVEILIELNSDSGRLVREYTMLLDPIEMQANKAASANENGLVAGASGNASGITATPLASIKSSTKSKPKSPGRQVTEPDAPKGSAYYQIKNGDSLIKIADQFKYPGVSLEQMLVALQRNNSPAFINNNMNLIRSGSILTIPDISEVERVSQSEASKIVLAQSVDFDAYRGKLANQTAQGNSQKSAQTNGTGNGKITAKVVETPTPANEATDKLKLSKAQSPEQANIKTSEEDKIAKQRALDAATARIKELEESTAKLQKILELQNSVSSAALPDTEKNTESDTQTSALPTIEAKIPEPAVVPRPVAPQITTAQAPEPQAGFNNWIRYLPYGAALLALLGGVGIYLSKRKKKVEYLDDESILTGSSMKANSLFGSSGGQSVDTNNSMFNSNFVPSASQLDANDVDPIAEADVYIAYGRDEQAEEILKEALRTQPDRQPVRVKLLEIYAHRKDIRSFETVASELYGMTGGDGSDWAQAASLGIIIDPQNPLYAGGQVAERDAVLGASTLPIDSADAFLGDSVSQQASDSTSSKIDSTLPSFDLDNHTTETNETNSLDFDLGLTTTASENSNGESEEEAQVTQLISPGSSNSMIEDFQLPGHPLAGDVQEAQDVKAEITHPTSQVADTKKTTTPLPETSAVIEENGMSFAALDFDFDIPTTKQEKLMQVETDPNKEENKHENDSASEVPKSSDVDQIPGVRASMDFDLSGIDLELPKVTNEIYQEKLNAVRENGIVELAEKDLAVAVSEEDSSAEMATKLDLAVAYQEIGDRDGARELLNEVLKGGNQEQISRAKTMMGGLA